MNLNQWSLRSRLTIGIVLLSAIGFGVTFYGTANALNGYLVGQIDNELNSVVGGTAMRLDRGATIQQNDDEFEEHRRNRAARATAAPQPLQRIPTTLSVTLLGADGSVKGELGGDLTTTQITDHVGTFTNAKAIATESKPFTIKADGPDFRAIAVILPRTGDTVLVAQSLDAVEKTAHQLAFLFGFIGLIVLLLIAIILGLLLRSIFAALILLVTVIVSFVATLGASALVFNHFFKFAGADTGFPLFAFVFLVALGIDYNIFLMTRVREESMKIGTRAGVIKGVTVTGAVITSAGIVLAATFTVLGVLPLVALAEIAFTVAVGVLLDTLVVRSILVPAIVHLIGPKIWWPSKLQHGKN